MFRVLRQRSQTYAVLFLFQPAVSGQVEGWEVWLQGNAQSWRKARHFLRLEKI